MIKFEPCRENNNTENIIIYINIHKETMHRKIN